MNYLLEQPTAKKTPQSQPILGKEKIMERNNAGGFAFTADMWTRLERFLILGSSGGTYYVSQQDLTKQNVDNVRACIAADGLRAVQTIRDISLAGRAPKNDPALYALALAASGKDQKTTAVALAALPAVARIGTHLFTFAAFVDTMRGWGPALRRAVGAWYLEKSTDKLAYQLVKYQQRDGWSHRDLLRLTHPKSKNVLMRYAVKGNEVGHTTGVPLIEAFERGKTADEKTVISLIREFGLTREMIPTEHQKSPAVWDALLEKMPATAMIRTLGRMSARGLIIPFSDASAKVVSRLNDREFLKHGRVHPIQVLAALLTYKNGRGQKGSLSWTPVPQVVDALNDAFYSTFGLAPSTGKRFYIGIDVSRSMTGGSVAGLDGLTPNMGAAAMAMLVARTEPNHFIGGFATQFVDLGISKSDRLDAAMKKCQRSFGGTDCAAAIQHALANKYPVDAFVVITDGETWAGDAHNAQAIVDYRQKTGIDAKMIVINMVANRTSLKDPVDAGSLDVVGFDASVPTIISGFMGAATETVSEDIE